MKIERMKELREKGWTLAQIAAAADISTAMAFRMLGGRQGASRKPYKRHKYPHAARDRDIRKKRSQGATVRELGALYGLSRQRIHIILKGEQ